MNQKYSNRTVTTAAEPRVDGSNRGFFRLLGSAVGATIIALMPHDLSAQAIPCVPTGQPLITVPEIPRDPEHKRLRGVIVVSDEERNLWFPGSDPGKFFCQKQYMRFFKGYRPGLEKEDWQDKVDASKPAPPAPTPPPPEPLPGPTLRARVGDSIEITFLNQINPLDFGASIDVAEKTGNACDQGVPNAKGIPIYPGSDTMPNCIHGSSTANIHFHGTHTTPDTTGDNVLLQIRPSLRNSQGNPIVTEASVEKPFDEIFKRCQEHGSPTRWQQLPEEWRDKQRFLLQTYDASPVYQAAPLWPANRAAIRAGVWPQFYIGAFPYCFRVPEYPSKSPEKPVLMGQAPGTHWYHAHKHGSTDINVSNGMTGALIIEGDYDDKLNDVYKTTDEHKNWGLKEQVLVFQELGTAPNLLSGAGGRQPISVNGRREPAITMRPNQIQMWRIVNGAARDLVTLCPFQSGLQWRQIAQDGVQFRWENYNKAGNGKDPIQMAAGNRVDLLVQAPSTGGDYQLNIAAGVTPGTCPQTKVLLRVTVNAQLPAADPPMTFFKANPGSGSCQFPCQNDYPAFPKFLDDIPASEARIHRELVFNTQGANTSKPAPPNNNHYIDGKQFSGHTIDQSMLLDTVEEWTVLNTTTNIAHPFHIHVNPFQIIEVFNPNNPGSDCKEYNDLNPKTWKPCKAIEKDFVWWDVFAIPQGKKVTLEHCTSVNECEKIKDYKAIADRITCDKGKCSFIVPGHFKMRSRFADFPGQFVLHCHILAHEDRGMMQLIEVVPNKTLYEH